MTSGRNTGLPVREIFYPLVTTFADPFAGEQAIQQVDQESSRNEKEKDLEPQPADLSRPCHLAAYRTPAVYLQRIPSYVVCGRYL